MRLRCVHVDVWDVPYSAAERGLNDGKSLYVMICFCNTCIKGKKGKVVLRRTPNRQFCLFTWAGGTAKYNTTTRLLPVKPLQEVQYGDVICAGHAERR